MTQALQPHTNSKGASCRPFHLPRYPAGCARSAFTIVELLIVIVVIAILAVITIVAYNGVQTRARASAASQALSQAKKKLELYKVDAGNYPATGSLASAGITNSDTTYQYTSTGTSYCITATNGTVSYYLDSTTHFTPTQGGCTDHTYEGGVQMTNLVTNGDFSGGVSGWFPGVGWSVDVVNKKLVAVGVGSAQFYRGAGLYASAKVYLAVEVLAISSGALEVHPGGVAVSTSAYTSAPGRLSVVYDLKNTAANGNFVIGRYGVDNLTCEATRFLAIDLTAAFGAGNEPTKAQMDTIMQQFPNSWFNGTVTANTKGIL